MNSSNIMHIAWFTFFQAACSTLMALFIGLPAAFFCGKRDFFGRKFLLSLSAVPFCVPSLIIALGYVTFLGVNGALNNFLMAVLGLEKPPLHILYSFLGLVIAHGFYNFPLIMKNVAESWEKIPCSQAESARLLGASEFRIFKTITFFQLLPSIASSCMLVFIYCFLSFMMVLLFGGVGNSTLEVEIYKAARAKLDFRLAGMLAFVETGILCAVTVFYSILEEKTSRSKGISSDKKKVRIKLAGADNKKAEICVFCILLVLIFSFFLAPVLGIFYNAFTSPKTGVVFTFASFDRILKMKGFVPAFVSTVKTAACTGLLCTLLGFLYSVLLKFLEGKTGRFCSVLLKVLPMLPMSVSSVVVGIVITSLVKRGSFWHLVLAQTFLFWPLAFRVIFSQLQKITSQTLDSALLLSKNKVQVVVNVFLPLCKTGVLSAFGFCFSSSAGDTTLPLVLAIPKFTTLSLFTYRLAGAYKFNEACAAGSVLAIICAGFFLLTGNGFAKKVFFWKKKENVWGL
ncbi:MAG: iron ABC transporter permease [Treponema sp.]|nr:iron ABC transporter permease [Treponema sp.]